MKDSKNPLSPHLQIYKPQITSVLSIIHRFTGIFLGIGMILLTWWLFSITIGPEMYQRTLDIISSWIGLSILFSFIASFFYHLFNGVRHLIWDAGIGFEIKTVTVTGWLIIFLSIIISLLTFILEHNNETLETTKN